jgi:hypothetical protein
MAVGEGLIELQEWGPAEVIPASEIQNDALEAALAEVGKRGILRIRRVGQHCIIEPRQFVGALAVPGFSLRVSPRYPKLFSSLRPLMRMPERSVPGVATASGTSQAGYVHPAVVFTRALEGALERGLPSIYRRRELTLTRPRGRIMATATLRTLHSRGIRHAVRCAVSERYNDLELEGLLASTMRLISLDYAAPASAKLSNARFAERLRLEPLSASVSDAVELISSLTSRYSDWPEICRLLTSAEAVISGRREVWDSEIAIRNGDCRFADLNVFWERAILGAFRDAVKGVAGLETRLHPLAGTGIRLLRDGGPAIDPDIVVFQSSLPRIVVDAKYTDSSSAIADDVYQVQAYVDRLRAKVGVMAYVSEQGDWFDTIGTTEHGAVLLAFGVSTETADASVVRAARQTVTMALRPEM